MRIEAYKAYLNGHTKFAALNKNNINVDAYLDADMKANAKDEALKHMKELKNDMSKDFALL